MSLFKVPPVGNSPLPLLTASMSSGGWPSCNVPKAICFQGARGKLGSMLKWTELLCLRYLVLVTWVLKHHCLSPESH